MSKNTQSLEPDADQPQRFSRPFDAVVIALSAALLVIFGIVIGRFIVTKQAVAVVDHFDAEVKALKTEIVELNCQIVQSQARCTALEESSERFRRLAHQQQIRAESLAARQLAVRSTLAGLNGRRDRCLDQVQQYVALDQPVPAPDVLRFAEAMFELQAHTIDQLASGSDSMTLPTVPGFPPATAATSATARVGTPASSPASEVPDIRDCPTAKRSPLATTAHEKPSAGGVFFAPPRQRRAVSSIYFAARRNPQALSMPKRSGVTFHETATNQDGAVRR